MSKGEYSGSGSATPKRKRKSPVFAASDLHILKQDQKRDDQMGRKCTKGKAVGVGENHNSSSSIKKREKKKKKKLKLGYYIHQVREMEAMMVDMRREVESDRHVLQEGEATVEELKALVDQKREVNQQCFTQIVWGELLAHHIQFNILPYQ